MNNATQILAAFRELALNKNISRDDLHDLIKDGLLAALAKRFGTDVGFMEDSDPALEFELLQRAGLSADQILAALTTAPANRLPGGGDRGRVAAGMIADLVVLDGDPAQDPRAWTRLRYVFRDGRKLFDSAAREDR